MNEPRWQRITYMPGTGAGEDGARLTGCPEHAALSRSAAAQGMVLLKNDDSLLPFAAGQRVAVFGKAQEDYVKGGGGSGDVICAFSRTLLSGLEEKAREGRVELYAPLSDFYRENVAAQRAAGREPGYTAEPEVPAELLCSAREFTDTALITVCRFSREGYDRTGTPFDGDFYLSREEAALVSSVTALFPRAAVVLNTGGIMDVTWFKDSPVIKAALLMGQAGMEGGLAAADILCGAVNPSGHLTDTFADSFEAYPGSDTFAESDDYVEYTEDIYAGYRYFETLPGAAGRVCYPFGYGLSYTSFSLTRLCAAPEEDGKILISGTVTNTGSRPGRQVLQVYCAAPQGLLGKASRVLTGFEKTGLLQPGESETLSVAVDPYFFSSYDDEGLIKKSAYVLEKGEYTFFAGFDIRSAQPLEFTYRLEEDTVVSELSAKCVPQKLHRRLRSDGSFESLPVREDAPGPDDDLSILPFDGQAPLENPWRAEYCTWLGPEGPQFADVASGKTELDDFIALLSDEQKANLLGGQPNRGPANTFGIGNLQKFGIPNAMTADGPAGLRFRPETGVTATAFPVASLLACTWDRELVYEVERAAASEVYENGVGVWLAPAINIHRSPLCGRNFEYFSEDPFLAGELAAAAVKGIQSMGVAASLKHFACNNRETNRRESDSRLSERALREIYLKAFEICVRKAQPWTIMTSYNIINGTRASENRDLLTGILRDEWGFAGLVETDWYTHGEQYKEINAGNDLKMGCGMPEETLAALASGALSRACFEQSVRRVLSLLLKLA